MIEKGKFFMIPIFSYHRDSQYFPEPEKFNPDRFSFENRHNIDQDTYLPFGIGPRNCIGSRFALMEIKTVFYYLLSNFKFEPNEKSQIPLELMKKTTFGMQTEKGIWMTFKPRK
jgi:cytochrome P450 family 9